MDLETEINNNVNQALIEDIGTGDLTALLIPVGETATASVISRENAVLCGTKWFEACFWHLAPEIELRWSAQDGAAITPRTRAVPDSRECPHTAYGGATRAEFSAITVGSRHANQALCRRGIRNQGNNRGYPQDLARTAAGTKIRGEMWRRHEPSPGFIRWHTHQGESYYRGRRYRASPARSGRNRFPGLFIQIEVETLDDLRNALNAGAKMILLDNFDLDGLREAVALNAQLTDKEAVLEASGGITLESVRAVAETGVDRISVGSLTKDIKAVDLSMRFSSKQTSLTCRQ